MQTEPEEAKGAAPQGASGLTFSIAKIMEPDKRLADKPRISYQSSLDSAFKKYVPVIHPQNLLQYPVLYYHPGYHHYLRSPLAAGAMPEGAGDPVEADAKEAGENRANNRHKTFTCTDCGKVGPVDTNVMMRCGDHVCSVIMQTNS